MSSTSRHRMTLAGAVVVLLAGLIVNWTTGRGGVDFPSMYVTGHSLITGTNLYGPGVTEVFPQRYGVAQPMGMFYPPATAFSMLPFALLPYELGKLAWRLTIVLILVFGVRSLIRVIAPRSGSHVWMLCAGGILLSSTLRWGMMLLQGAPVVLGLLCLFVAALHGGRTTLGSALAIIAVAIKMTLALPFVGILLLRRRFFTAFAAGATWVLLNVLGFLRMGGLSVFKDYQRNVTTLESFGNINAPDPWNPLSLPRLDWTSLIYGLTGYLPLARLANLALAGAVTAWLLWKGVRTREPMSLRSTALFLPPLVCLGSLCVYHHQYDACLFFAPALVAYFVIGRRSLPRWALVLVAPLFSMILFLPIGLAQRVADDALGPFGVGLLHLSFPVAFSLALIATLAVLQRLDGEPRNEPVKP